MASVVLENVYKSFHRRSPASSPQDVAVTLPDSPGQPALVGSEANPGLTSASGTQVLRRINLTVADGEFLVLVGPSGCGKSTLLRIIAGLEQVTAGTVWIGDRIVNALPPKQRDVAMVFQNYALYPHMTVYENLAFGLRRSPQISPGAKSHLLFQSKEQHAPITMWQRSCALLTRPLPQRWRYLSLQDKLIDQRVQEVAHLLQIETLLDRLPKQLSGGQKQRVALGRAMARNPQVFLMDEPLSNLDAKLRTETRSQIVNLQHKLGVTTVYVTHDQVEAMTMGDRIAVMNAGQIQQIATPLELYQRPANRFVAEFIGSPTMNFLPVQVASPLQVRYCRAQFTLPAFWQASLAAFVSQTLWLGIRPEHVRLCLPGDGQLNGKIHQIEMLGSEIHVSVQLQFSITDNPVTMMVKTEPDSTWKVGDTVGLSIVNDKIHLFCSETGAAICNSHV